MIMNANTHTVNNVGRPAGTPKSGGVRKGGIKTQTVAVKEAVLRVFHDLNKGDAYLRDIAKTDPKLFLSLVARLIPAETNATVDMTSTVHLDLGAAMREADTRLAATCLIEHEPGGALRMIGDHCQVDDPGRIS